MKRIAFVFLLALFLVGCYATIGKVENRWGPPGKVEVREDTMVYYYYFYMGRGKAVAFEEFAAGSAVAGWVVVEITTDSDGKILKKRKYWMQPKVESTSPTSPTIEQPKEEQTKEEQAKE